MIQTEEYQYHDPVTSSLKELYIEFDLSKGLTLAEEVVGNDFFLSEFKDEFFGKCEIFDQRGLLQDKSKD